jgi:hypothetical protein
MKFLLLLLITTSRPGILTFDEINHKLSGQKKETVKEDTKKPTGKLSKLQKENEQLKDKLDAYRYVSRLQLNVPYILKEFAVNEADIIGATTSLSIRATSTGTPVTLTNIEGSNLPKDSKIICNVIVKYKRVCGPCTRIVIDGVGYDINAEIRNKDGSSCAIGELSDDGKKYLTGLAISEMAQGALAVSQSSLPTFGGNILENNASNRIKQGMINVGDETSDIFREKMRTQEPIVFISRGEKVAVYFKKGLRL